MEYQGQTCTCTASSYFILFHFSGKTIEYQSRYQSCLLIKWQYVSQKQFAIFRVKTYFAREMIREKKARGNLYVACVIWNRKLDSVSYVGRFDCLFSWEKCKRHAYSNLTDLVKNVSSFDESNSHWRTIETRNEMQK